MGLFNFLFKRLSDLVFSQVDFDGDNALTTLEVEVAILHLYNVVNKRLPGWQEPPTRVRIKAALAEFDTNHDGVLNKQEFYEFAKSMIHAGPDTFFARVGKSAVVQTAIVPSAAMLLQRACSGAAGVRGSIAGVPLHFLAPAVGVVFSGISGLIPYRA